jgi:hypothetical protein
MTQQHILIAILVICAVNGIVSPYNVLALPIAIGLMPELFPKTEEWVRFFAYLFLATCTLLFSGVPAAIYERLVDRRRNILTPMYIWLAGAVVLSLPALGPLSRL